MVHFVFWCRFKSIPLRRHNDHMTYSFLRRDAYDHRKKIWFQVSEKGNDLEIAR